MKIKYLSLLIPLLLIASLGCSLPVLSGMMATDTPVPTNTSIPTLTPQPTFTLIPTEAPAQTQQSSQQLSPEEQNDNDGPVTIINENGFRIDEWDYIVGLVQNNTEKTIEWVEITVLLYDEDNQVISTSTTYPFLDMILAGDTSPFSVSSDQWSAASSYDFLIDWEETDELPASGLEFANHTSYSDENYLNIVGEVRNSSDQDMTWVKIAAALYAADGTLLNADYTYAMLDFVAAGGTSPFKVWFGENWQDGETYEIQAQGIYQQMPVQVVELVNHELSADEDWCVVKGNVRNTSTETIMYATIIVGFYDANNNLLQAEWNYNDGGEIPAGETDLFEVISYECPPFDHYEVFVLNTGD